MKKLLLAVPLVAGASWAGASWYSGTQTQSAYDQLLTQLNELKPFTLVNESYGGGLTRSHAVTQVLDSASADAKVLFRLQHEIDHSPVGVDGGAVRVGAATIRTTLLRDGSLPEVLVEFLSGFTEAEPFVVDTQVGFDGHIDNHLQVSPYRFLENGTSVDFGGVDYSVSVSGDAVSGSGILGAFEWARAGNALHLSPGKIRTELTRISQSVYSGSHGVDFDTLSIRAEDDMNLQATLGSIGFHGDTTVDGDLLSSQSRMSVGRIDSLLPINAFSLETAVTKLSIEGIEHYVDTISQVSLTDAMFSDDEEITRRILDAYAPMIGPGTGVDVALGFSNDGGDASLAYGISMIDETAAAYPVNGLASIVTLRDLLNAVTLEAHLDADVAAIDQTPLGMFMMSPQAQQIIVADGVSYKSDMTLSELIVDINGKPLALEMMLGDKLDTPLAEMADL
ncbi:DUF945 family protein [Granulosicoccus sp. 3-233]|uniref:DUF945 family protein n=1 Tax=Granulosicoccus sp. 3-233 TaxID=3417969 RepID=UPI003D32B11C